ncbi:hypothetical protein [Helicobacter ibis]|uniref:Uncharacterized protein n=1 Tax=Helicobacter ibis TaxID=2962633 RepID=A0ABT4VC82_9HELI|nr:hypothetical protein [Helicobacter ibis]MDA3968308.1 hypothetical protein [Helicobacter ibis]
MKIYIYPNGGQARYIQWALEFLGYNHDVILVDDNSQNSFESLQEQMKKDLKNDSKLFLSSPKLYDKLLPKIKKADIPECYCGVSVLAKQLNEYFLEKLKGRKVIAVFLSGFFAKQKHLGDIVKILKDNGFCVVWITSLFHHSFDEIIDDFHKQEEFYLCADCEFLEKLNFFPFIIEQGNIVKLHSDVKSLKIVTSMEQLSNIVVSKSEMLDIQNMSYFLADYVNIHSESFYKHVCNIQSFGGTYNPKNKLIQGGYPSIDNEIKEFGKVSFGVRDTIIFISSQLNFDNEDLVKSLIIKCLDSGFRVIFKSCPPLKDTCEEREIEFANNFKKYEKFVFYDNSTPRIKVEDLRRSITLIEVYSSLCYSYPSITKRPCILIYPQRNSIEDSVLSNDIFYNENLHIRIFLDEIDLFMSFIFELSSNIEIQKQWKEKIDNYCKNDLYNFGNASEYLANWIMQWYNNREILKNTLL